MFDVLVNLIGAILFAAVGFVFMWFGNMYKNAKGGDYAYAPIGKVEIIETYQGDNPRWIGRIVDKDGHESFCVSDLNIPVNPSVNIPTPKEGTLEDAHLLVCENPKEYLNGKRISYIAHFCNEKYYALENREIIIKRTIFYVVAAICYTCAVISLIVNIAPMISNVV